MITNEDIYECPKCGEIFFFDTAKKPYATICSKCKCDLIFIDNGDCDSERAEEVKNTPPYDPTQDPNSPYYIPVIRCPYCQSTDTTKISTVNRVVSTGLFGLSSNKVGKEWHCNKCKSNF